jgi:Protein of unknown function (DUF1682)
MTTVYIYETILLLGLVFFFVNYFSGKGKNLKIAQRWLSANLDLFKDQFSVVGLDNPRSE